MTSWLRAALWMGLICCSAALSASATAAAPRPNILLIITDDQGWGDLGFHGNPVLQTPHLDRLASESVELTRFHVCPVCSPTRAGLMTGRYNYRTGVVDTFLGRSTMAADETTLAEMLTAAGYRTGIFGKWHLGDNYPSRAMDQGFGESLVHRGGGIAQASDPPGNTYFDPILLHNGRDEKTSGYASDIFADAAMHFIDQNREQPFFAYLAFNCPHTPLQLPEEYHRRYQNKSLDDQTAKIYGMIANIDDNLGRLFAQLEQLKLADNTIVIFMTDNGPQQGKRFNGNLRDLKGSVFDGGIRSTCLVRWPGQLTAGRKVDAATAHIDLTPTLLAACAVERPGRKFDGLDLLPLLRGTQERLPERMLFFQWHRGDQPERYRACAIRSTRYKLVQGAGREGQSPLNPVWELFDMEVDPGERNNIVESEPGRAAEMKAAYDRWFDDVSATRGYPAPRIVVGTPHENPVTLTRQDWRGPRADWGAKGVGYWDIEAPSEGIYTLTLRMPPTAQARTARLKLGDLVSESIWPANEDRVMFAAVELPRGITRVEATAGDSTAAAVGVHYVDVRCLSIPPAAE